MVPKTLFRLFCFLILISISGIVSAKGGSVHVKGYTRKNGTYVAPHYRSSPDRSFSNNWSTKGNVNPYTGKAGTRVTPPSSYGGGYSPSNNSSINNSYHNSPSYTSSSYSQNNYQPNDNSSIDNLSPSDSSTYTTPISTTASSSPATTLTTHYQPIEPKKSNINTSDVFFGTLILAALGFGGFAIWKFR